MMRVINHAIEHMEHLHDSNISAELLLRDEWIVVRVDYSGERTYQAVLWENIENTEGNPLIDAMDLCVNTIMSVVR